MNDTAELEPILRAVTVPAPPARAFSHFVDDFGRWWPRAYSWAGDTLAAIGIEAQPGGHCYEIGPGGFRCDWGTVLVYQPPGRLAFSWQINPDRTPQPDTARAGVVEVRFVQEAVGFTRVILEHRGFERCGKNGAAYRAVFDGEEGWTYLLANYAGYCDIPIMSGTEK